jgi:hypothetical protein
MGLERQELSEATLGLETASNPYVPPTSNNLQHFF